MSYKNAYDENHTKFEIRGIEYEDDVEEDAEAPDVISFVYERPSISVDTAGRFATHKIVGGSTVRQKIGEDPVQVAVSGVCREPVARQLDGLRDAKWGTIYSNRLVGGSLDVHFGSMSTSPLDDGGAVAMTDEDAEFLYAFDLSCVEVVVRGGIGTTEQIGTSDETGTGPTP